METLFDSPITTQKAFLIPGTGVFASYSLALGENIITPYDVISNIVCFLLYMAIRIYLNMNVSFKIDTDVR